VAVARELQRRRGFVSNARIPDGVLDELVRATPEARRLLGCAMDRFGLSARAARRILRVARTVADLAGDAEAGPHAMGEALGYRTDAPALS
jgi:magnesium chelatase family protein